MGPPVGLFVLCLKVQPNRSQLVVFTAVTRAERERSWRAALRPLSIRGGPIQVSREVDYPKQTGHGSLQRAFPWFFPLSVESNRLLECKWTSKSEKSPSYPKASHILMHTWMFLRLLGWNTFPGDKNLPPIADPGPVKRARSGRGSQRRKLRGLRRKCTRWIRELHVKLWAL